MYVSVAIAVLAIPIEDGAPTPPRTLLDGLIRRRIENAAVELAPDPRRTFALSLASRFYEARAFAPAWIDAPVAREALLQALDSASEEGVDPEIYGLDALRKQLSSGWPLEPDRAAGLDLSLTTAFLRCAWDFSNGHLDPQAAGLSWYIPRVQFDPVPLLESALGSGDPAGALRALLPGHQAYRRLRNALARYRGIAAAGGWSGLPAGPPLRIGMRHLQVEQLRSRLALSADLDLDPTRSHASDRVLLDDDEPDPSTFDPSLMLAVMSFQERHGLDPDGIVGPVTRRALAVPVEVRIDQLRLNLERWRWLPRNLGHRYLLVDIAGFQVRAFRDDEPELSMKAIVGRRHRQTPVFADEITYLVFGPYWNVPRRIAIEDLLPAAPHDPAEFRRSGLSVFNSWRTDAAALTEEEIDWAQLSAHRFPYRFRQEPGPSNPLGRVKFMFPNPFDIYLHDTPAQELFDRPERAFSSGCIRVADPQGLAHFLLEGAPEWTAGALEQAMLQGHDLLVTLPEPVPVYLVYWTAWVDSDSRVRFHGDLYGRDEALEKRLRDRLTLRPPAVPESGITLKTPPAGAAVSKRP